MASQIEPISEDAPLAPDEPAPMSEEEAWIQNEWLRRISEFSDTADRPKIRTEESVPSPSRRRRKVGLLLWALFLVVSAAALGVLAKEWIVLSAITNAVKSSLPSPSPAPPNKQPVEVQGPATPAASATPAPPNKQPVEVQGPATPAASETPAPSPQCNIRLCKRLYRSFDATDCTYQPVRGPRRICDR